MASRQVKWKWWHPVSTWHVLGIFVLAQLLVTFAFVAMKELGGIAAPQWIAGGIGGGIGVVAVNMLVRKRRAADAPEPR